MRALGGSTEISASAAGCDLPDVRVAAPAPEPRVGLTPSGAPARRRSVLDVDVVRVVVVGEGQRLRHVLAHGPEAVSAALPRTQRPTRPALESRRGQVQSGPDPLGLEEP